MLQRAHFIIGEYIIKNNLVSHRVRLKTRENEISFTMKEKNIVKYFLKLTMFVLKLKHYLLIGIN